MLVLAVCAVAVLALGGRWLVDSGGTPAAPSSQSSGGVRQHFGGSPEPGSSPAASADRNSASGQVVVHVSGFVRHPGVYRLAPGSRVYEAIDAAGGASRSGDPNLIDLAARIVDGSQLLVPKRGSARTQTAAVTSDPSGHDGGGSEGTGAPVSLSQASVADLDRLNGIGPALAARIVAWRDSHGGFKSIDDLDNVPGIGPAKLDALRPSLIP